MSKQLWLPLPEMRSPEEERRLRSRREQVLQLRAQGLSAQQIADTLGLMEVRGVFEHLAEARAAGDKRAGYRQRWVSRMRNREAA